MESNVDVVLNDSAECGYQCQPLLYSSDEHGTCQKRKRFFVVAIREGSNLFALEEPEDYDELFETLIANLRRMKVPPCLFGIRSCRKAMHI